MPGGGPAWIVLVLGVLVGAGCGRGDAPSRSAPAQEAADPSLGGTGGSAGFVGSSGCRDCHAGFYELWAPSWHGRALQPFTPALAAAELEPQAGWVEVGAYRYRAELDPGPPRVVERGPEGESAYPIAYAVGGKNVYQFLTPLTGGRLQVLPVSFDARRREWFGTLTGAVRHAAEVDAEETDWRSYRLTFNSFCESCHVSQFATNYDLATGTYHTTWREPGINCETCHGPGAEHIRRCEADPRACAAEPAVVRVSSLSQARRNDLCASCHAKLSPLTDAFVPGESFFDHFDLAALESGSFYPDGRDRGETYTWTGWLLSRCARASDLGCLHCHTSSGRFLHEDQPDASCLPCHEARVREAAAHSHHAAGSPGSECISCHMPKTTYARMVRSDHSMAPPTPATTVAFESPNACGTCHADREPRWADSVVRSWRPGDYQAPVLRRAELVAAARRLDWERLPEMLAYIEDPAREAVFAASLIRLLEGSDRDEMWPVIREAATADESPLVRSSAAHALSLDPSPESRDALLEAAGDEVRLVRVQAARALSFYPEDVLPYRAVSPRLERAVAEYEAALALRPERWESHHNRGDYYLRMGELRKAVEAYATAVRLHPNAESLRNSAIAHSLLGEEVAAERDLSAALELDPDDVAANLGLGVLLGEHGKAREAEAALRRALENDPGSAVAAYSLAVVVGDRDAEEAARWSLRASRLAPDEPAYAFTHAFFLDRAGRVDSARAVLEELIARRPAYGASYLLLGAIYERRGEPGRAAGIYARALAEEALPGRSAEDLARRIESLREP